MNNKGQSGGLVTSIVFGVVSLIIAIIIAFVIVTTIGGTNVLTQDTIVISNDSGWINATTNTLSGSTDIGAGGVAFTSVINATNGSVIPSSVYTLSGFGVTNATNTNWDNVSFSYTYTRDSVEVKSTNALTGNFSGGVDNISSKIPTLILIAAIVLIIGVLAVLVGVWQRMKMTGSGSL